MSGEDEDCGIEFNLPEFNEEYDSKRHGRNNVREEFQVDQEDGPDSNGCGHQFRKPVLFTFNVLYVVSNIRGIIYYAHDVSWSSETDVLLDTVYKHC